MTSNEKQEVSSVLRKLPALVAKLQPLEKLTGKDVTADEIDECINAENPNLCRWTNRVLEMRREYEEQALAGKVFNRFDRSHVSSFKAWALKRAASGCGCGGHHKKACTCTPKAMPKTTGTRQTPPNARKHNAAAERLFSTLDSLPARVDALARQEARKRIDQAAAREGIQTRARAAAVARMNRKFANLETEELVFGSVLLRSANGRKEYADLRAELIARQATEHATKADEVTRPEAWVAQQFLSTVWSYADRQSRIASMIETVEIDRRYGQFIMPVETSGVSWFAGESATDLLANPAASAPLTNKERQALADAGVAGPPPIPEGGYVEITLPTSRLGTSRIVGKPKYLNCSTSWTGELEEDSMTSFAPAIMNSVLGELARLLDSIVCDSDSTDVLSDPNDDSSANNSILYAGHSGLLSESSTLSIARDPLLLFSGLRKKAISDSKATDKNDAALNMNDILDCAAALEVGDSNPSNIVVIAPARTRTKYTKVLLSSGNADAVKIDENGNILYAATKVVFSENMARRTSGLTDGAGALNATAASNNRISLLSFDKTQWRIFRYPGIRFYVRRRPRTDVYEIDFEVRIELKNRPGTSQAASMLYALDPGA